MGEFKQTKKICSFYVSNTHFITMLLPYINKELEKGNIIKTFLEYNFNDILNLILDKIILKKETREQILKIDWKENNNIKTINIEKVLKKLLYDSNNEITIIINGQEKYINRINMIIDKFLKQQDIQININIVNCYEVNAFNDNIREILDKHEYILNTSGINKIEDVFDGYERKIAN